MMQDPGKLIIGVGTGRCGTKSLVRLLAQQPATHATHERFQDRVRWNCPKNLWPLRLWRDTAQQEGPPVRAEVALHWTPHIRAFLKWADQEGRTLRVVGLKRSREETIDSYMRWKPDADHWSYHGHRSQATDDWDHCYPPEMEADSKREAIGLFWDRVYSELESIDDERVKVFRTEDLNTEEGVRSILSHCGYEDPVVDVGIQIQAPTIEDARNSTQWES
jgi:hypothetical protein